MQSFDFKNGTGKAMIVITDGENHEDNAVEAAAAAKSKDVSVNVVGVGSANGAPIPMYDEQGHQTGFRVDHETGQQVVTKLSEDMCREISAAGGGVYVRANNSNSGLGIVMDQIGKLQRKTVDSRSFKDFEDRFQFFLAIAFVLLLVEFFISNRKNMRLSGIKLFEVKKP
jgi:Ca-activated chloride channel family protein